MFYFRSFLLATGLAVSTIAFNCLSVTNAETLDPLQRLVVAQIGEKPSGEGLIKTVDRAKRKVEITHGPIAALKWPGKTMAFNVAPNVDLTALAVGAKRFEPAQ
jgi:Cu/Ag efflux protein CusF